MAKSNQKNTALNLDELSAEQIKEVLISTLSEKEAVEKELEAVGAKLVPTFSEKEAVEKELEALKSASLKSNPCKECDDKKTSAPKKTSSLLENTFEYEGKVYGFNTPYARIENVTYSAAVVCENKEVQAKVIASGSIGDGKFLKLIKSK